MVTHSMDDVGHVQMLQQDNNISLLTTHSLQLQYKNNSIATLHNVPSDHSHIFKYIPIETRHNIALYYKMV